jgi:hypothetical protein
MSASLKIDVNRSFKQISISLFKINCLVGIYSFVKLSKKMNVCLSGKICIWKKHVVGWQDKIGAKIKVVSMVRM